MLIFSRSSTHCVNIWLASRTRSLPFFDYNASQEKVAMKRLNPLFTIPFLAVIIIAAALCLLTATFEIQKPVITPATSLGPIGAQKTITIRITDNKSGLKHVDMVISQNNQSQTLSSVDFPEKGILEKTESVVVNPLNLKLHNGEATVTITASDHSLFQNTARMVEKVVIDTVPPQVSLLSTAHNISPGGSCLAVYRISKDVEKSGVQFGKDFFSGYPVELGGKKSFLSYFPVPLALDKGDTKLAAFVKDNGGNEVSLSIPYRVKQRKFRKDILELSDNFLNQKMPEYQQRDPELQGKTIVDTFVYVNEKLRDENFKAIQSLCLKSSGTRLWKGPFLRMKNAAPMAGFGDIRTYLYQKKTIGGSTHMGVDLASTAHAPIEAANSGVVLFTGYLGIYGNTVIVDHGQGILSLYAHMNDIKVNTGQQVSKEEILGSSGSSGLAGGDHLHFSIIVGGRFVNPVEWWDPHWIQDNVEKKISEAS